MKINDKITYLLVLIILSGCGHITNSKKELIEMELEFIEVTPIVNNNYNIIAFEDNCDSLYFILSDKYIQNDTNNIHNLKYLVKNCRYKLHMERTEERVNISFFIRGGRFKYNYYKFIRNDTLIGKIFKSPNIIGTSYIK